MALFVCALVTVDVVILLVYTLVEGLMGNLEPKRTVHAEHPDMLHGVGSSGYMHLVWSVHVCIGFDI